MEKDQKKQNQIKIELDDNVGQGEYANFAVVTHSPAEFVMDYYLLKYGNIQINNIQTSH